MLLAVAVLECLIIVALVLRKPDVPGELQELREEAERRIVKAALDRHGGHLTNTARALGLADHASLSKVIKRLGIERGEPGRRG